nr:MAG TPA: hypothetical protein [Caudoviricetes sp.]
MIFGVRVPSRGLHQIETPLRRGFLFGGIKPRGIEPIKSSCRWQLGCPRLDGGITIMSSNPLGSTAPDNSGPIGWAEKEGI